MKSNKTNKKSNLKIAKDACELIGHTPLLELNNLFRNNNCRVLAKMECLNPTSIKDRAVLNMIYSALQEGKISSDTEVVEASSGNTAIAIASLGATLGYKTRIYMSESCSIERQKVLCAYGAKIVLTPSDEHTRGARERAIAYCAENPDRTFFLNQHGNFENGRAHELTTGPELWMQTEGNIGAVIIGLGTSGTFDGLSRYLKSKNLDISIIGFEPAASPVYSGGKQGEHRIIGIGPGFVTDNFKRSRKNLDELIAVEDVAAYEWTRRIAQDEGVLVGPTSGAAASVAALLVERPEFAGKTIICIFCDSGERYLSTPGLFPLKDVERIS
jgi:cysteine synthase A